MNDFYTLLRFKILHLFHQNIHQPSLHQIIIVHITPPFNVGYNVNTSNPVYFASNTNPCDSPNFQCPEQLGNSSYDTVRENISDMVPPSPQFYVPQNNVCAINYNPVQANIGTPLKTNQFRNQNNPNVHSPNIDICFNCFDIGYRSRDCTLPCQRKNCTGCHHGSSFKQTFQRCRTGMANSSVEVNNTGKILLRPSNTQSNKNLPTTMCPDLNRQLK